MRVAIISFRTFEYGGVERYAYQLVNHLSKKAEVHLFTNKFIGKTDAKVHLIPAIGKKDIFTVNSFMYFLHRRLRKKSFDIVHSMGPLYLYPDVVTAHMCQKKLLSEAENLFKDFSVTKRSYWKIRTLVAANFQRFSFNNAKKVITVSSLLAKELKISYSLKEPVVIYPGIDFSQGADKTFKKRKREELGINENAIVILFVGGQWTRKGLKYAIGALSFLSKNVLLLVVGSGDTRKYLSFAKQWGVKARVLFLGFKKDVTDYYAVSDILVLPSLYEAFGYPVLEAMAMGLPVVVSSFVGAAEIVEEGKTGYIVREIENPQALSRAINHIIIMGPKSFEKKVREKARQFLWENNISRIMSLYGEVIEEKKRANK